MEDRLYFLLIYPQKTALERPAKYEVIYCENAKKCTAIPALSFVFTKKVKNDCLFFAFIILNYGKL
jgi:hypothetical protein